MPFQDLMGNDDVAEYQVETIRFDDSLSEYYQLEAGLPKSIYITELPAPERMVSPPDVHAPASQDLRLPPNADHRPPLRSSLLTLQSS